jgi:hypothetical protein
MLRITRYGTTRFWALWDGNELVAVVVYKKGAAARQAQALAAHARALARQAQAAAQAARARAQPSG